MTEISHLKVLLQLERYQQLAERSEQLLSEAPQHQSAALYRIAAYLYSDKPQPALQACAGAQAFCFDQNDFWLFKAQALRLTKNWPEAEQAISQGLALSATEADLLAEQALLHLIQQRLAACRAVLDTILAVHPFHKAALHTLALLFDEGCHRPDRARAVLKRLLQHNPTDSDTAQLLATMVSPWRGAVLLKKWLKLTPADRQLRQNYITQRRLGWVSGAAVVLSLLALLSWLLPAAPVQWLHALLLVAMALSLLLGWHHRLVTTVWLMLLFPLILLQDMPVTVTNGVAAAVLGALYAIGLQWLLQGVLWLWLQVKAKASWAWQKWFTQHGSHKKR